MKRVLILAFIACAAVCAARVEAQAQAVDTDVCAIVKNPASFNGKMVRVKATVSVGFDQFLVRGGDCGQQVNALWLAYPPGAKGKAGPDAVLEIQPAHNFSEKYTPPARTPVTLERDKAFKEFDSLLAQTHSHGAGMCLGCARYMVSATLVGRLDGVASALLNRNGAGQIDGFGGFGNMNAYPARLVLESVTDVTPKEIDYSKSDAETKGETQTYQGTPELYDPIEAARKMAAAIGNIPAGVQAQKDAGEYPKPGERNGVMVSYGATNEASPKEEELSAKDSPDGVQFNCIFNTDRLQGDAEVKAILHMGQHIADLRNPSQEDLAAPPYILEFNAWAITTSAAMVTRQKYLTLDGGYTIWDASWPASAYTENFTDAMKSFLTDEALLSR